MKSDFKILLEEIRLTREENNSRCKELLKDNSEKHKDILEKIEKLENKFEEKIEKSNNRIDSLESTRDKLKGIAFHSTVWGGGSGFLLWLSSLFNKGGG